MALGNDVVVRFLGDTKALTAATAKAGDDLTKFGNMGKIASGAMVGIAVAAGVVAVASVKMATTFQQSMELLHTQAGVAQSQIGSLSEAVLNLAPKVGTGPDQLSEALFHIESTINKALPPAQQMSIAMDRLKIAAEGAKVGNADLTDVTNALNATVASGISGTQSLSEAMGSLNAIVGAGDMHMQDLADAMGSGVLAVIKGYGVNLTDAGAALATFGDNNIRGADAATMLRMSVQSLTVGTPKAAKMLKELGLQSDSLAKEMQTHGLSGAINMLVEHLNKAGIVGPKVGQYLTEAFGKKAGPGLAVLVSQIDRFNSKVEEVKKGAGSFGDAWQQTTKTAAFQFSQLKDTVTALAIKLGTALLPVAQKLTQWALTAINWMEKHAALTRNIAIGFGILAAAIYLVLNPWIALIAAAVAIGIALKVAYDKVGWFRNAVNLLGAGIKAFGKVWAAEWNAVRDIVTSVWHFIEPIINAISGAIGKIAGPLSKVAGAVTGGIGHLLGFANGTSYAPGGLAVVGERGPELVNLPRGSQVYPNGTGPGGGIDYDRLAGAIVKAFNGVAASSQVRARSVTG